MEFNTAIFYDVENLLKGYSFSQELISSLSLKEIMQRIRDTGKIGQVAVQRAYANWSDPRLNIMRGEIIELGIDPIQIFGFSRGLHKNAADIQLAIDAVDLAHIRPSLQIFVIVSGDGAFASLAKKLHEYGKTIIGCAYKKATNRVFEAVCDAFVWITDPDEEKEEEKLLSPIQVSDPRVIRMARNVKSISSIDRNQIIAKTKEVLKWFENDSESNRILKQSGMYLSVIREAMKYTVPDFEPVKLGFPKFVEYLQFACQGTQICVFYSPPSEVRIAFRDTNIPGFNALPDLTQKDCHSLDRYHSILSAGSPTFRLPHPDDLKEIAYCLIQNPLNKEELGDGIEKLANVLGQRVDRHSIKLSILAFLSAGCFERELEGVPLSEQTLTLKPEFQSEDAILQALREGVRSKLITCLGEVNDNILQEIIPL